MAIEDREGLKWAKWEPTLWERLRIGLGHVWHHWLPSLNPFALGIGGLLGGAFSLTSRLGLALSPLALRWWEVSVPGKVLIFATFATVIFTIYIFIHETFIKDRKKRKILTRHEERSLNLRARIIDLISDSHSIDVRSLEAEQAYRCILNAMEAEVRTIAGDLDARYFNCSLLLFDDAAEKVWVEARHDPSRRIRHPRASRETMAYWVAKANLAYRAVPDLEWKDNAAFRGRGLSENDQPYRSVLFLPIIQETRQNPQGSCYGLVSIDSGKPCQFTPRNAREYEKRLMPFIRVLAMLLRSTHTPFPPHGDR